MAAWPTFDRLVFCLPAGRSVDRWFAPAACLARTFLPECTVEVVASPSHRLHDVRRGLLQQHLGRHPDTIHLVPTPDAVVRFAADGTDQDTLLVCSPRDSRRLPRRIRASALAADSVPEGRHLLALVNPVRDTIASVRTAQDVAARLGAARVIVCRIFFDETALRSDEALERATAREQERLEIFMTRVPEHAIPTATRVVHSANVSTAVSWTVREEQARLVVSPERLRLDVPALILPETVVHRQPAAAARPVILAAFGL